jgi:hypothetical protein
MGTGEDVRQVLDEELLAEVLAEHADALNRGEDRDEELLARYPHARGVLVGLFGLVRRLREALIPIKPSERFVTDLKAELEQHQARVQMSRTHWRRWRERALQVASILGLIVSAFALMALIIRGMVSLVTLIVNMLSRRRRGAATPA